MLAGCKRKENCSVIMLFVGPAGSAVSTTEPPLHATKLLRWCRWPQRPVPELHRRLQDQSRW